MSFFVSRAAPSLRFALAGLECGVFGRIQSVGAFDNSAQPNDARIRVGRKSNELIGRVSL